MPKEYNNNRVNIANKRYVHFYPKVAFNEDLRKLAGFSDNEIRLLK